MKETLNKFKKGAASFYIVAFSTLILVIVAASFAMVIISEVTRASNDDLSQSAYDSALAGVEDAKLAFAEYQKCVALGHTAAPAIIEDGIVTCGEILYWMEKPDCDMVGHILGRIPDNASDEEAENGVMIADTIEGETSEMNQAYTCVMIETTVNNYRSTLTAANQVKVVKVAFGDEVKNVKSVRVSWFANEADTSYEFSNFLSSDSGIADAPRVAFQPTTSMRVATPPTLEVQLIQTTPSFSLAQFNDANGSETNRATVYLVPSDDRNAVLTSVDEESYVGAYNGTININSLSAAQIAATNNKAQKNLPFGVYCNEGTTADFICSTVLNLPAPVGGTLSGGRANRSDETFMLVLSLPYKQPDTDFSIEFCTETNCTGTGNRILAINNSQVVIDSTGRANDLYRRVETRLEPADNSFAYPYYALQLLGDGTGNELEKDMTVTREWNSYR